MKTREQIATELYNDGRDSVMQGGDSLRMLAGHIPAMVYGVKDNDGALWQDRAFPDKTVHLDMFEDYILKPARDGLGIPSLLWLSRVLDAHEDKDEREKALAALRQEIPDFDAKVEDEQTKDKVRRLDAEGNRGAPAGNQNAAKGKENKGNNVTFESTGKARRGNRAEYIIARLKRDAATDTHAAALLGSIEAGDIKPYRAAIDMGWVKTPDPARVVEKQREKMTLSEQVAMWEQWGRSLPEKAVDRVGIAVEALLNCTEGEQRQVWKRVRSGIGSAAHC